MTATARPWRVWGNEIVADNPHDHDDIVIAVAGVSEGTRSAPHYVAKSKPVKAANLALIVRAVNNHEPMLVCLKSVHQTIFGLSGNCPATEKLAAIIAAAEKV